MDNKHQELIEEKVAGLAVKSEEISSTLWYVDQNNVKEILEETINTVLNKQREEIQQIILECSHEEYGKIQNGDGFLVTNTDKLMFRLNSLNNVDTPLDKTPPNKV